MRKKTFALLVLSVFFIVVASKTSGVLCIACGLIALGLGLSAWIVQSAGWVDENYDSIPDPDQEDSHEEVSPPPPPQVKEKNPGSPAPQE